MYINPTETIPTNLQAYRGSILHFLDDPNLGEKSYVWHSDGLLIVKDGIIYALDDYTILSNHLKKWKEEGISIYFKDLSGHLILPGFIDTHIHYPQTDIIASPGHGGLLPWLEKYVFPTERKFQSQEHAKEVASFFFDYLLSCGTTSAMVYCTVHPESVETFFIESEQRNLRMIAGKVMMDRHCPEYLRDTARTGVRDSEILLKKWHRNGRQLYAISPRFAPTSSEEQLSLTSELALSYPDVYLQTHLAENKNEIAWVKSLFPQSRSYLDVYDHYGFLRPKSMYGHCIWLDQNDRQRLRETQSSLAICPSSNLFLGSGLFDFEKANKETLLISLATDIGAGTNFSLFSAMNEAYKTARMKESHLSALYLFYLATLGGARSLHLEGIIGNFLEGTEADFIVIDLKKSPLVERRLSHTTTLEEYLFALMILGDNRLIKETYVMGKQVYNQF